MFDRNNVVRKSLLRALSYSLVIFTLALLITAIRPSDADAAIFREGNRIVIEEDETINDDLYVAGSTIRIEGKINGDLIAAGSSITVNGDVSGSAFLAGSDLEVNGKVNNSIRTAGQNFTLGGQSGRDVIAAGNTVTILKKARISRDFVVAGNDISLEGSVERNLLGAANTMNIEGSVSKNVRLQVNKVNVGNDAKIGGYLKYKSENEAKIAEGAEIEGRVDRTKQRRRPYISYVAGTIYSFLWLLLFGVILFLLFPRFGNDVNGALESRPWISLGWGFLLLTLTPFAALLLMITIIGIPIALILLFLYVIALYVTKIYVGYFVGGRIFAALGRATHWFWPLLIGLLAVIILSTIPFIGWLVRLAVVLFGLGALILTLTDYHSNSRQKQPVA